MKNDRKLTIWEAYLTKEIGIEFKACLYFFAILFFYCCYRMINHTFDASILHMAEMIFTCYIIGYIQVYLFANFDEADRLGTKEITGIVVCTIIYSLVSYFGNWFEKRIVVTLIMAAYILLTYFCVFII